jgi:hypothetical protein
MLSEYALRCTDIRCTDIRCHQMHRHQMPSDAQTSDAIRCTDIRCHQMPSDAIRCHQMPSDAIRCHQMPSDAIRCNQAALHCKVPDHAKRGQPWGVRDAARMPPSSMPPNDSANRNVHVVFFRLSQNWPIVQCHAQFPLRCAVEARR